MKLALAGSLLALAGTAHAGPTLQCLDEDLNPVDWWFVYKMNDGVNYAYKDSTDTSYDPLTVSTTRTLDDTNNAFGGTLNAFFKADRDSQMWVMYNDEFPDTLVQPEQLGQNEHAHAKGIFSADESGGFWLLHSIPKFPEAEAKSYSYTGSDIYGQTALCITLDAKNAEVVASQLQYYDPMIYGYNSPEELADTLPTFAAMLAGDRESGANAAPLKSAGGHSFVQFAKSPDWGKDLGEDLVEPYYKQGFAWETWRRSPYLESYCTPEYDYDSVNVMSMGFDNQDPAYDFAYTKDHSKWGYSLDSGNLVCVGGINRMDSQRQRGGGTTCMERAAMWHALDKVVNSTDPCA